MGTLSLKKKRQPEPLPPLPDFRRVNIVEGLEALAAAVLRIEERLRAMESK